MITLGDPCKPLETALMDAPGGFAWWYLDLVDEQGNGVVVIASFGLPFLPGYSSAARAGNAPAAGDRPSLNIVCYHNGRTTFYLLQEYERAQAVWADKTETVTLANSRLSTRVEGDERILEIDLDCVVPGDSRRLTGSIRVRGPAITWSTPNPLPACAHAWTPLTTATPGHATLHLGADLLASVEGRAYHDRNGSSLPLTGLGIGYWLWGRTPTTTGERIHYLLWPDDGGAPLAIGVEVDMTGRATVRHDLTVQTAGQRRGWFGMSWPRDVLLSTPSGPWMSIQHHPPVDDGFFYLRFLTTTSIDGAQRTGVAEAVNPTRIDLPTHRPLVRMAVHHATGWNSPFVTLFAGLHQGRFARLLGLGGRT